MKDDVQFDEEKAKLLLRTTEFLFVFGALLVSGMLFQLPRLLTFLITLATYAIVNGVLMVDFLGIKTKIQNLFKK